MTSLSREDKNADAARRWEQAAWINRRSQTKYHYTVLSLRNASDLLTRKADRVVALKPPSPKARRSDAAVAKMLREAATWLLDQAGAAAELRDDAERQNEVCKGYSRDLFGGKHDATGPLSHGAALRRYKAGQVVFDRATKIHEHAQDTLAAARHAPKHTAVKICAAMQDPPEELPPP